MNAPALTVEDLELARQIALRRGYLAERSPALRSMSLSTWHRRRGSIITELSDLEKQAIARHGTVAALLAAAFGKPERGDRKPESSEVCLDDVAHGESIPAGHCDCFTCRTLDQAKAGSAAELSGLRFPLSEIPQGVTYDGPMTLGGRVILNFTEDETKSSFALPPAQATPERIAARAEEIRASFRAARPPVSFNP
jgi:hypothetical protein